MTWFGLLSCSRDWNDVGKSPGLHPPCIGGGLPDIPVKGSGIVDRGVRLAIAIIVARDWNEDGKSPGLHPPCIGGGLPEEPVKDNGIVDRWVRLAIAIKIENCLNVEVTARCRH